MARHMVTIDGNEAAAAGTLHGALQAGALATTFTDLALMAMS
jgi:pyruvate/2-oxoacid:ferredoxin oxidoreductase alpha subunit